MRIPLMAGNWKMFKLPAETSNFFDKFLPLVANSSHAEIAICPPFIDIPAAVAATAGSRVQIGGQTLHWERKEGAFTGEISGPMLKGLGCALAIVGHSERRQFFGETNETVFKRTSAAIESGLTPIVCVGETLPERESGTTEKVLEVQFSEGLGPLSPDHFAKVVIAYEPVWAIGTGKVATPEMAQSAHRFIRGLAASRFGPDGAANVRILYGGSVKPDNTRGLMAQPDVDGALVGGASLDPASFASIVNF